MDHQYISTSVVSHRHSNSSINGEMTTMMMRRSEQFVGQNCPSFSSTLLDAIYRSIDESHPPPSHQKQRQEQELFFHQEIPNSHTQAIGSNFKGQEPKKGTIYGHQSPYGINEKGYNEKPTGRWNSTADPRSFRNSSTSSSDSSSNKGGFSSSESSEYNFETARARSTSSSSCYSIKKLKPIRMTIPIDGPDWPRPNNYHKQELGGGGVAKAKSKASKIYGEFKKVSGNIGNYNKPPISPSTKLSTFLNSLFNSKKSKIRKKPDDKNLPESGYIYSSTCSSASSFSRSCLSKTPSSRGKLASDGTKRSVRFCLVDEDRRPCGQKGIYSLGSDYSKARENRRGLLLLNGEDHHQEEEEDGEDDGGSCASSDLFELENLNGYSEELPVYETTNVDTNRAIANGFIV